MLLLDMLSFTAVKHWLVSVLGVMVAGSAVLYSPDLQACCRSNNHAIAKCLQQEQDSSSSRRRSRQRRRRRQSSPEMYGVGTLARWREWWRHCGPHLCCPLLGSCACLHADTSSPAESVLSTIIGIENQLSSGLNIKLHQDLQVNHHVDTFGSGMMYELYNDCVTT